MLLNNLNNKHVLKPFAVCRYPMVGLSFMILNYVVNFR